jgi:GNAT superfamily N-acetyltransferase
MKIEFMASPNNSDIEYLTEKINTETKTYGEARPFGFFIRDESRQIIAGANGFVIYGKIYTDQLWVEPAFRNQGLARELMEKVQQFGLKEGCTMASISTMSFQKAVPFYKRLGYQVDFERHGHVNGSSCFFMSKSL